MEIPQLLVCKTDRRIIYIAVLLMGLLLSTTVHAQVTYSDKGIHYALVEFGIEGKSGRVKYNDTDETLKARLGQPDSSEPFYYEMDDKHGFIHFYGDTAFYTRSGHLVLVEAINTATLRVYYLGNVLKLGDGHAEVKKFYPHSVLKSRDWHDGKTYYFYTLYFLSKITNEGMDTWLSIGITNDKVTEISIVEP